MQVNRGAEAVEMRLQTSLGVLIGSLMVACVVAIRADEGMWTFDHPPAKLLQERYGFTPSAEWLEHLQLASVRFNDGGFDGDNPHFSTAHYLCKKKRGFSNRR